MVVGASVACSDMLFSYDSVLGVQSAISVGKTRKTDQALPNPILRRFAERCTLRLCSLHVYPPNDGRMWSGHIAEKDWSWWSRTDRNLKRFG